MINTGSLLNDSFIETSAQVTRYRGNKAIESKSVKISPDISQSLSLNGVRYEAALDIIETGSLPNRTWDLTLSFIVVASSAKKVSLSALLTFTDWSVENYVMLPGAVYVGNRFASRSIDYPPLLDAIDAKVDCPTIIGDVPRLLRENCASRLQQLTRDLATPAVALYCPNKRMGFVVLTPQNTRLGDTLYDLSESEDKTKCILRIATPGVREESVLKSWKPYRDRGADLKEGELVTLRLQIQTFESENITEFLNRYHRIRKDVTGQNPHLQHRVPFSVAWDILEQKYSRENWCEDGGYVSLGPGTNEKHTWQLGWVGGLLSTYPLLMNPSPESIEKVASTFDFWSASQTDCGLFLPCFRETSFYGDGFEQSHAKYWFLMRRAGDALYFGIKQFDLMKRLGVNIKPAWELAARRLADYLVSTYATYGQFGQFADFRTGKLVVGNSTSAGIAPAGLALASSYFSCPAYLNTAIASAKDYFKNFVANGYTTGGPGEALQCPDSESAYGILESFITLFQVTGELDWLDKSRNAADLCSTWNVSYDFQFRRSLCLVNSTLRQLERCMQTFKTSMARRAFALCLEFPCFTSGERRGMLCTWTSFGKQLTI